MGAGGAGGASVGVSEGASGGWPVGILDSDVMAVCVCSADDDPLSMDVIVARLEEAEVRKVVC